MSPKRILNVDLILFAQVYRIFSQVLENKNLFQILALTDSRIEGA